MSNDEGGHQITPTALPPVSLPLWRLRFGPTEAALVQALLEQRKRYYQNEGHASLCLTQDELVKQLGLPCETPLERQRAVDALRRTIWRVKPKLAVHDLVIVSLHGLSLDPPSYALFRLQEVRAVS